METFFINIWCTPYRDTDEWQFIGRKQHKPPRLKLPIPHRCSIDSHLFHSHQTIKMTLYIPYESLWICHIYPTIHSGFPLIFHSSVSICTEEAMRNAVKTLRIARHKLTEKVSAKDFNKEKQNENFSFIQQHILCIVKESAFVNPLSKRLSLCAMVKHSRGVLWVSTQSQWVEVRVWRIEGGIQYAPVE